MGTMLTVKGQVTIPKHVRDALDLAPGTEVDFEINGAGELVLRKSGPARAAPADRFEAVRGTATVKWRSTDELMALLRD